MFRPYWPPMDDPMTVSLPVAERLKCAGFPGEFARLGWVKGESNDFHRLVASAESEFPAPSASELLAYYLENGTLENVTLICRRCDYMASDGYGSATAGTVDDAIAELALARCGSGMGR